MELDQVVSERDKQQMLNPNMYAPEKVAPLSQQKGMGGQMGDMVKQKLMSDAAGAGATALTGGLKAAGTSALGTGAMTGMATAVPYVGAGLMAGKMLGLFNAGGQVGPLSPQYAADGDKARSSYQYQMKMGRQNKKDTDDIIDIIRKNIEFSTSTAPRNAQAVGLGDPIAERKYGAGSYGTYYDQGGEVMSEEQAMALMNNQPEPIPMPQSRPINFPDPEELLMEMSMPKPRPQMQDYGADRTHSPYDMLRPDNAPNT